jgi:hypothetical protein
MNVAATPVSGKGATAPGSKPVASTTCAGLATFARVAPAARATFFASARRSPGVRATTKRSPQSKTTDFTICARSQPAARAASRAVGVPTGNSSSRASAPDSRRNDATRSTGSGHCGTKKTLGETQRAACTL